MEKIIRYEEDRTGVSPDNLVSGEIHTLKDRQRRIVVPSYGSFFTESLIIKDENTGSILTKDQYYCSDFIVIAQQLTGKEIAATIIITDKNVSNKVNLQYQAVGGFFSVNAEVLLQQLETLKIDERPIIWDNILGKPESFPPSAHLHSIGDVYGFEYLVYAIDRLTSAILRGDEASHNVILDYVENKGNTLLDLINKLKEAFNAHESNKNNPHNVTAHQTGSLTADEINGLFNKLKSDLYDHINNKNNPHDVTAEQLHVYLRSDVDLLLNSLKTSLLQVINNHINDKNNPHNTTPEQIGTWTSEQIQNGFNNVNNNINNHVNDKNNPHNVTTEQINAYTKQQTDSKINEIIEERVLDVTNRNKLKESATPINTDRDNLLSWENDGISLKINDIPEASVNGKGVVKLTDSINSTTPNTALSATGGKKLNDTKADKSVSIIPGAGLVGGGDLSNSRVISMNTPNTISAWSNNTADGGGHSHYVTKASTSTQGIVQLIDSYGSDSQFLAPTANALKRAYEDLLIRVYSGSVSETKSLRASVGYLVISLAVKVMPGSVLVTNFFGSVYNNRSYGFATSGKSWAGGNNYPENTYMKSGGGWNQTNSRCCLSCSRIDEYVKERNVTPTNGGSSIYEYDPPGIFLFDEQVRYSQSLNIERHFRLPPPGDRLYFGDNMIKVNFALLMNGSHNFAFVNNFSDGKNTTKAHVLIGFSMLEGTLTARCQW
jgi:hypothetical protein